MQREAIRQDDEGDVLVHRFLTDHPQQLGRLSSGERDDVLESIRQLGCAWAAHRLAPTEQDRTRALREVDAAMAELDLLAERLAATHGDEELARILRTMPA